MLTFRNKRECKHFKHEQIIIKITWKCNLRRFAGWTGTPWDCCWARRSWEPSAVSHHVSVLSTERLDRQNKFTGIHSLFVSIELMQIKRGFKYYHHVVHGRGVGRKEALAEPPVVCCTCEGVKTEMLRIICSFFYFEKFIFFLASHKEERVVINLSLTHQQTFDRTCAARWGKSQRFSSGIQGRGPARRQCRSTIHETHVIVKYGHK